MLVLRRKEGQWLEIKHKSGDVLWIRLYNIKGRFPAQVDVVMDDDAHNFKIVRGEAVNRQRQLDAPAETVKGVCV